MVWVLQNEKTQEVWTGSLENKYGLLFHGVKFWDEREDAEREAKEFLRQQGVADQDAWRLVEVDEDRLKLYNVRLNNDVKKKLFLQPGGKFEVRE